MKYSYLNYLNISRLLITTLLFLNQAAFCETIVAGICDWYPWMDSKTKTGILIDIFKEVALNSGNDFQLYESPTERRNKIDWGIRVNAELGVIPEWRKEYGSNSIYTIPIICTKNVILAKKGKIKKIKSVSDLYGKTVGTNLGYCYLDGFQEAFQSGIIKRDDTSNSGSSNFDKLLADRFDCAIFDRYEARCWIKAKKLKPDDFEEIYEFQKTNQLCFRLHINKSHLVKGLDEAIRRLRSNGTISKIADRYIANK